MNSADIATGRTVGPETDEVSERNTVSGEIVLQVQGLKKAFGGQQVLRDVSAQLRAGEVVLLRGDNGSGKTTLLNILTGNLHADSGTISLNMAGRQECFDFPLRWWQQWNPFDHFTPERMARGGVGRTWQDIRLFNTQTLLNNVAVAVPGQFGESPVLVLLSPRRGIQKEKTVLRDAQEALEWVGIGDRAASSGDMVSLGQAKRTAIARALQGSRILFLDEPLSGLDEDGVTAILALLQKIAHDRKVTLVIVEHVLNIPKLLGLATTLWTLRDGQLVVESPEIVKREQHQYPLHVRDWMHELSGLGETSHRMMLTGGASLTTTLYMPHMQNEYVLEIADLIVRRGRRLVIGEETQDGDRGLSFRLRRGEFGLLEAPNGWGKTTLLQAIAGLLPISQGTIRIAGKDVKYMPAWDRMALGLTLMQSRDNTFPSLTVREALRVSGLPVVPESLQRFQRCRMSDLSGGEKQRVALSCAMSQTPLRCALLDEPFSALDRAAILEEMRTIATSLHTTAVLLAVPNSVENHTTK